MCSVCDWTKKCFGCLLLPDDQAIYDKLLAQSFIAIDWNHNFLDKYVQVDNFKPIDYFGDANNADNNSNIYDENFTSSV